MIDLSQPEPAAPTRRNAVVVAAAGGVALVVAVIIGLGLVLTPKHPAHARDDHGRVRLGSLVLDVPADWHAVTPTFVTATVYAPTGWITNMDPGPQCTPGNTGHIYCHAPVGAVGDGQFLISFTEGPGLVPGGFDANSSFVGFPAQKDVSDGSGECAREVDILARTKANMLQVQACFGDDTSAVQIRARELLAGAEYQRN